MAEPDSPSVLSRIVAAHRRPPAASAARQPHGVHAFARALSRGAAPYGALITDPREEGVTWDITLAEALEGLPPDGIVVGLQGAEGARGLIWLNASLLDGLIEMQTTGRVDDTQGPPRPVTRIDAALSRDFIDLVLSGFAAELSGAGPIDWVARLDYGSVIAERRGIALLMPETGYHLFSATMTLGGTKRTGEVRLLVPSAAQDGASLGPATAAAPAPDPAWRAGLHAALGAAPLVLEAVLLRQLRSLAEVEALRPGDLIPFDPAALSDLRLEGAPDQTVLRGRLGQKGGARAVRLGPDPDMAEPDAARTAAVQTGPRPRIDAPVPDPGAPPPAPDGPPDAAAPDALSGTATDPANAAAPQAP